MLVAMAAHAGLASPVVWWLVIAHGEGSACLGLLLLAQTGAAAVGRHGDGSVRAGRRSAALVHGVRLRPRRTSYPAR
jgi:hypothetical protein